METQPVAEVSEHAGSAEAPAAPKTPESLPAFLATWPRTLAVGVGAGLVWGAIMRAWMRFISESPEFSWSGTVFILLAAAIAFGSMAAARKRRLSGGVGWWRFSFLTLVGLGAGGAVMWPAVVLWAVAIGRRRPGWMVSLLLAAGAATQIPVVQGTILDNWRMSGSKAVIAIIWYVPMLAIEAWAFSVVFSRSVVGYKTPSRVRNSLIALGVAFMAMAGIAMGGIPM